MSPRSAPPLRQEQQAATRERLLTAARECFVEDGFIKTTVDQIVQRAGTSRATFYLHFRGKNDALAATWSERELPEMDQLLRAFDARDDFGPVSTRTFIDGLVAYLEANAGIMLSAQQAMSLEPELATRWVSGTQSAATDMPNLVTTLGGGDAGRDHVMTLVFALERAVYFWVHGDLPYERDRLVNSLTRIWSQSSA